MSDGRTGLLIIRAWVEAGSAEPLRAHLRLSTDVTLGIERTMTLSRPDAVGAMVQEWLAGILAAEQAPPGPVR